MTDYEIKQIQEYLNKKFSSNKFIAKKLSKRFRNPSGFLKQSFIPYSAGRERSGRKFKRNLGP